MATPSPSAPSLPWLDQTARHLYPNYRQPPIVMQRGQGSVLWDMNGNRYLDLVAGIAVATLGHAHPKLVSAIAEQAGRILQVSNHFYNEPNLRLAAELTEWTGYDRAFFCNSGTEAVEAALKLARRHFTAQGQSERYRVLAFDGSFHGRTMGALAATGQSKYRDGFGPLVGVTHLPYGDLAAVESNLKTDVCAVILEPVLGEGGVIPAPPGFISGVRAACDRCQALLVADEVQTGVGRTGRIFGMDHYQVRADVVALAKGLGGGVPIGAVLCDESLAGALPPGSHGTTFGGNALASAAALAVLSVIRSEHLVEAAASKGALLAELLGGLKERHPTRVAGVRGLGLLQALVLAEGIDPTTILGYARNAGVLLTAAGKSALRFSPALTVTPEELREGVNVLDRVLGENA